VYIATSDDTMSPDCLEKMVATLERRPDADVAVCGFQPIDAQSLPIDWPPAEAAQFLGQWATTPSVRSGKTEFLLHAVFGTVWFTLTSVLFRRRLLEKTGLFPTDMGSRGDEEWVLRAALASDVVWLPERLATWRVHGSQATPPVTDTEGYWRVLRMLRRVLRDPAAGVPAEWRGVPSWRRELETMRLARYRFHLRLSRWDVKTQPRRFLCAIAEAARRDPAWLLTCARRRFVPPEATAVNPIAEAGRLIRLFDAPWPPYAEP
jgi:GT2 family glycosyltransferase